MRPTRRTLIAALSSIGLVGSAKASEDETGGYGVNYGESYGGPSDCFIATAATHEHSEQVTQLRSFRDDILVEYRLGRAFIECYYRLSPPVARWIDRREYRRRIVRKLIVNPAAKITKL